MKRPINAFCLVYTGLFFASSAFGGDRLPSERPWVHQVDYARFHTVVPADATDETVYASEQFRMYWRRTTGWDITVSNSARDDSINVWIGGQRNPHIDRQELLRLEPDGFIIRTVGPHNFGFIYRRDSEDLPETRALAIAGENARGTLYGVYQFFQTYMGVFWTPGKFEYPMPPAYLPPIEHRYSPPFWYRDISYHYFTGQPWYAAVHRLNGFWSNAEDRAGGHISYVRGRPGFGHTFHYFVDPDEYFAEHPEYFAEVDGQRTRDAQLCLTNPNVLRITIDKALNLLRESAPNERILSISQMDFVTFDSWCTCVDCATVDAEEGSHAGTIIRFVNQVAAAVETEFPDAYIDTFAYTYSRKPPRHARPRDNVIVRFCPIEADYSRPMNDCRSRINRAIADDLRGWTRIARNVFVWEYTQNWFSHQGPHPNLHVIQPNMEFYADVGVDGVYAQASWESPHSDFEYLKGVMLAYCMWNPETDWRALRNRFLDVYYEEAAPFILEYLQLITDKVKTDKVFLGIENEMQWMDYDAVVGAQRIFERAFESAMTERVRERLRYAYLPVQYAALVCPPKVERRDGTYVLTRPPSQTFDEFWDMILKYGVTRLNDWPISYFRDRLDAETPPRHETLQYTVLENAQHLMWLLPDRGGSVIRWQHKPSGTELLDGYRNVTDPAKRIQDWHAAAGDRLEPIDKPYSMQIGDSGASERPSAVLETEVNEHLIVTRRLQLLPDEGGLDLHIEMRNTGDATISDELQTVVPLVTPDRSYRWRPAEHDRWLDLDDTEQVQVGPGETVELRHPSNGITLDASLRATSGDAAFLRIVPEKSACRLVVAMDALEIRAGESRTVTLSLRIR